MCVFEAPPAPSLPAGPRRIPSPQRHFLLVGERAAVWAKGGSSMVIGQLAQERPHGICQIAHRCGSTLKEDSQKNDSLNPVTDFAFLHSRWCAPSTAVSNTGETDATRRSAAVSCVRTSLVCRTDYVTSLFATNKTLCVGAIPQPRRNDGLLCFSERRRASPPFLVATLSRL